MTASFTSTVVRDSDPKRWLAELALNVADGSLQDNIVRVAVTIDQAYGSDLDPDKITRGSDEDYALPPGIKARWLQLGYMARGQMHPASIRLGCVADLENPPRGILRYIEKWRVFNRETSDRELEIGRQVKKGIEAFRTANGEPLLQIRGSELAGENPNWRGYGEIGASPDVAQVCITCIQPIKHANGMWRHEDTGRAEVYDESPCPACNGSRAVPSRRKGDYEKCQDCLLTPGVKSTLNHLADPEQEGRKV